MLAVAFMARCVGILLLSVAFLGTSSPLAANSEVWYDFQIVHRFPHDPGAFTQGLLFYDGYLYESTGLYGRSSLRKVELETGEVIRQVNLSSRYFGEGLVMWGDRLVQLTWQEQTGFVYDRETFQLVKTFSYAGEGWGLTHDGRNLLLSNGSSTLLRLDPDTYDVVGKIDVVGVNGPVTMLNELEYVRGEIWANIWLTDRIVRIEPETGRVLGWIDLTGLLSAEERAGRQVDVLNGIAYDPETDRIFVTGKLWPFLYEIEVFPRVEMTSK